MLKFNEMVNGNIYGYFNLNTSYVKVQHTKTKSKRTNKKI